MMRSLTKFAFWLLLALPTLATASTTVVTLTVVDADGQAWFDGYWTVDLVAQPGFPPSNWVVLGTTTPVPNQTQTGRLDGTATATFTATDSSSIAPAGSAWRVTACPLATTPLCYSQEVQVGGGTQTLAFNPPGIRVSFEDYRPRTSLYGDFETVSGRLGNVYYRLTDQNYMLCKVEPCGWFPIGGGGGGGGTVTSVNVIDSWLFGCTGGPVTTAGTITCSPSTGSANLVPVSSSSSAGAWSTVPDTTAGSLALGFNQTSHSFYTVSTGGGGGGGNFIQVNESPISGTTGDFTGTNAPVLTANLQWKGFWVKDSGSPITKIDTYADTSTYGPTVQWWNGTSSPLSWHIWGADPNAEGGATTHNVKIDFSSDKAWLQTLSNQGAVRPVAWAIGFNPATAGAIGSGALLVPYQNALTGRDAGNTQNIDMIRVTSPSGGTGVGFRNDTVFLSAAQFYPAVNFGLDNGDVSHRWANIYGNREYLGANGGVPPQLGIQSPSVIDPIFVGSVYHVTPNGSSNWGFSNHTFTSSFNPNFSDSNVDLETVTGAGTYGTLVTVPGVGGTPVITLFSQDGTGHAVSMVNGNFRGAGVVNSSPNVISVQPFVYFGVSANCCFNAIGPMVSYSSTTGARVFNPAESGILSASLTTTAAASDNVTINGATSSSHCTLGATNSTGAADIANVYISAKTTNQITVTHSVASGETFDIICTTN